MSSMYHNGSQFSVILLVWMSF